MKVIEIIEILRANVDYHREQIAIYDNEIDNETDLEIIKELKSRQEKIRIALAEIEKISNDIMYRMFRN